VSPDVIYTFCPFELDGLANRLRRHGTPVSLGERYLRVLAQLAAHAGTVVPKNELVTAGWGDLAVKDNSLAQAISALRRVLGRDSDGQPYVETVPRQGYRLRAVVARRVLTSGDTIEALLAPHRAWIDGRAALESLEGGQINVRVRSSPASSLACPTTPRPIWLGQHR
jgi:DNA-binding winged helix-turn-helix (wHTH) protein